MSRTKKQKRKSRKTKNKKMRSRQRDPRAAADPVTRGGLHPGLVPVPQLDVEALARPIAQMAHALGQAVQREPGKVQGQKGSRKTNPLSDPEG